MENSKKSGIAKLKKLGLTDEEINAMLGIEEIPPEEELEEAEEKSQLETVAWKKDFLIEQLGHYNKKHGGKIELEDWVTGIQDGEIDVHFDWKELAGIRPNPLNDPNSANYDPRTLFGGTGTGLKVNYTMNSSYSSAAHSHTENGDCYFDNETCSITFYYKRINTVTISASGSGYRVGEMIYIEPPAANYVNIPCPNCGNNSGNYGYNQSNSWVTYGPLGYYYNKTNSSCGDTNTNCWIGGFIAAFAGGGYVGATHQKKIYYVLRVTSVS